MAGATLTDPAAEEIADELLFRTGRAIMSDCFEFYSPHFELPLVLESDAGEQIVKSRRELRVAFDQNQSHFKVHRVADLVRTVVSAEFLNADTIGVTYVTKTIDKDGHPVGPPFPSYSVICRQGKEWRYVRCCLAIVEDSQHRGVFERILETASPRGTMEH